METMVWVDIRRQKSKLYASVDEQTGFVETWSNRGEQEEENANAHGA